MIKVAQKRAAEKKPDLMLAPSARRLEAPGCALDELLVDALDRLDDARAALDSLYCELPVGDENPEQFSEVVNWLYTVRSKIENARGALKDGAS